ncbi:Flp pilus assembly protein TadG [Enterobacter sp. BIGb0383]|uniref:VWA domain-containing protein n=1 Tax=unclassified Enterobacter TaxID=2608935 RepID=UPI000F4799B6|nr:MULTISPECIES: VWA domain-containing protein [unclassified Enterobacter]ROP59614.1 Flp pilus assembly protein TadG [Enterobacter sp. BIGb0383]ROS08918.1 Flp pilus assembly protein TadG [Enterobacter sp. BIGb0359]
MALKTKNKLRRALLGESAAVTLMFAAVFPSLVLFYSLAFDGASVNNKRARLMDGVNQGVLGVALTDNRNLTSANKTYNKTLLGAWTRYYLPGVTVPEEELSIAVSVKKDDKGKVVVVDYTASAQAEVRMMLSGSRDVGMGPTVAMTADSGAGIVRKNIRQIATPTDFIFVTDFSGSMKDGRIAMVKTIVDAFVQLALVQNTIGNTMAIVPYSIGTPEVLGRDNLAGGKEIGCSFVGKLKDDYRIDLDFWFNKNVSSNSSDIKRVAYDVDRLLATKYYESIVMKSISSKSWSDLISKSWCQDNGRDRSSDGRYRYSCESEPGVSIFERNDGSVVTYKKEFSDNYKKAYSLRASANSQYNVINVDTLDVKATLADGFLFSDAAITTYRHLYSAEKPFSVMCNGALPDYDYKNYKSISKPNYYPISLTTDPAAFTVFQSMTPLGGTDSANGLLRAVPVAAKGINPRKVIILLTDGEDSVALDGRGPSALSNLLIRDNNLCGVIKQGLLKYPKGTPTTAVDMYYFSIVDDPGRMKFWANNCVGSGHAIVAEDYQSLMDALTAIANKGQVQFINKNEVDN